MQLIKADMHIHTCLSPCAEVTSSPKRVVDTAYNAGLSMIFITDHNTMENAEAAMKASNKYKTLKVYPGLEITSREEVHTLALFENINDAYSLQKVIYSSLPDSFSEKEYNEQVIANEADEVEGFCKKSLFSAADLNLGEIVDLIHKNKGLAVAAHIDRQSFSVISQLGFIPENLRFDALEVSSNISLAEASSKFSEYSDKYKFIQGSDSHWLQNIGSVYTEFEADDNSYSSFKAFLRKKNN